ncbi:hypothetical protein ACFSR2_16440 [Emticicia soli]|uniref:Uncharacterized protein n=1 Tax=Emticicia soli TaxID=2027878 RepID=A0ABW5J9L0_9BACT
MPKYTATYRKYTPFNPHFLPFTETIRHLSAIFYHLSIQTATYRSNLTKRRRLIPIILEMFPKKL